MPKRLTVIDGANQGQVFLLPQTGTVVIGNNRKHSDICLHDLYVSRTHCEVHVEGERVAVSDRENAHGTLVNGVKVSQRELQLGDVIRVGNSHLRLEDADAAPPEEPEEPPPTIQGAPTKPAAPATPAAPGPLPHLTAERLAELSGHTLGHFEVRVVLAQGHYGAVFRAHDLKASQPVALKVLPPIFPTDRKEMQHFVETMKPVLFLQHPGLVLLRGLGKTGPYIWMAQELIEGEHLPTVIQGLGTVRKFKWRLALRVAIHIARALEFISSRRLVHANITPANILLQNEEGPARLNDLGLWEALGGSVLQEQRLEQKLLAELPYLSPEHIDRNATVDELSDQYSLGAVIYALLTGKPPCQGSSPEETMTLIRETLPVKPKESFRSLPDEFQAVVLRMLAKHPEERYPTPASLVADLEKIARERGETL